MKPNFRLKAALRSMGLLGAARLAYQLVDSDDRRKFFKVWPSAKY